jgi:hypothetical protein
MKRGLPLLLVAACAGAPPPAAPPQAAAPHTQGQPVQAAPQPTVEVARDFPPELRVPTTLIRYWAATFDDAKRVPITPDFSPGSAVTQTDIECDVEHVETKPPKATCTARAAGTQTSPAEAWFRDRFAACFRVARVAPAPATLRALERELLPARSEPLVPRRWAFRTSFATVSVHVHETEHLLIGPHVTPPACDLMHPCVAGSVPARVAPAPNITQVVDKRWFMAYGPRGYLFEGTISPANLFPETGSNAVYVLPELADRRGSYALDARFALDERDPRAAHDRLASLAIEHEEPAVRLALVVDRAVLAYKMGDLAEGKQRTRELEAFLARPHADLPEYARAEFERTRALLAALGRGEYRLSDPCTRATPASSASTPLRAR